MTEVLPVLAAAAVVDLVDGSGAALHPEVHTGPGLSPQARAAVEAGIPDSTRRAYSADFRQFAAWCAELGRDCLPATADTVTEYIAHLIATPRPRTGQPYSPSSLERVIASIRTAHKAAARTPPETKGARKALAGYRAALSESDDDAARRRAQPNRVNAAVPATLRRFVAALDRTTLKGKRDAALLLLGHAIAARASELVALNVGSVTVDPDGRGIAVAVYRKKVKRWTHPKVMYGSNPATCPVRAVLALLEALGAEGRTDGPLFVRLDRHGHLAPPMTRHGRPIGDPEGRMTTQAAADVIENTAAAAGAEGRYRGHSLRRGFVTAARNAGADMVDIGRHGGWADGSKALLAYVEEDDGWGENNPLIGIGL
ncbi:tyrosine-type recombinase/integrase [Streptomyces sp. NPDC001982]|uniref:tyrosine-type recombinase/integrase n=1 Tax=Streptomyces sp. NPDC001982 TaxID=3154405 RepID=UPI00332814CF